MKSDWMVWKDENDFFHVYCKNCGYEIPAKCDIPDVCPACHCQNIEEEHEES